MKTKITLSLIALSLIGNTLSAKSFLTSKQIENNDIAKVETKPEAEQDTLSIQQKNANLKNKEEVKLLQRKIKESKRIALSISNRKKFNLQEKIIQLKKTSKWLKIVIPYGQLSTLKFDSKIEEINTLDNKKNTIKWVSDIKSEENKKIIFTNLDISLQQILKIKFTNGREIRLELTVGDEPALRHIEYKVFLNGNPNDIISELKKGFKVKNITENFNNIAAKIINDLVSNQYTETTKVINESRIEFQLKNDISRRTIFDNIAKQKTIKGMEEVNFKMVIENIYSTPYVESNVRTRKMNRLNVVEIKVTNNMRDKIFVLSPVFIKNRFPNFVAFWLGDLDTKENHLKPLGSISIIIVTEDIKNMLDD